MLVEPLLKKFTYHLDRERGLSLRTQENYNRSLDAVFDRIDRGLRRRPGIVRKGLELHHLTRARLQREISRAADGSVRIVASAVRAFFRFLLLRGVIKDDIGQRLLVRQVRRERSRFFTEAQAFQLLDSPRIKTPQTRQQEVQAVRDCALLAVMYEVGLRSGEVCGLDVDSISWDSPTRGCAILRILVLLVLKALALKKGAHRHHQVAQPVHLRLSGTVARLQRVQLRAQLLLRRRQGAGNG